MLSYSQTLKTQWDSVSYALGIAWKNDLLQFNIHINHNSFLSGLKSFYFSDTSFFNYASALKFIEENEKFILKKDLPTSLRDSISYALGYSWAKNIFSLGFPLPDTVLLLSGMLDSLEELTYAHSRKILENYRNYLMEESFQGLKLWNEKWLIENANQPNVIKLPNGVQYKVIKAPISDKKPEKNSIFILQYHAKLIDGTIFESTKGPEKFFLSALIPGLHQVLLNMRVGEEREIYIPYYHAFGAGGIKNLVPPFATVIYKLTLVDVK